MIDAVARIDADPIAWNIFYRVEKTEGDARIEGARMKGEPIG
jgi:hypothetical protein